MDGFQFAHGTVIGKDHRDIGKNNNDGWHTCFENDFFIGVVCDGCGKAEHSEVGAKLGARIIVEALRKRVERLVRYTDQKTFLRLGYRFLGTVHQSLFAELGVIAELMGGSFSRTVSDYFLFTVVGVILSPLGATFFSIGDGYIVINGEVNKLGTFPKNEPPYLAYGLVDSSIDPELIRFKVLAHRELESIRSFLLGTDGVEGLIKAAELKIPGQDELVGPISQFWTNDSFYSNSFAIDRRLTLIGRDTQKIDWQAQKVLKENGQLKDDTTLIVGRRTGG